MCAKRHASLWGSRLRIEPFHTTVRVKQLRWIGCYTAPCVFPFAIATFDSYGFKFLMVKAEYLTLPFFSVPRTDCK